MSKSDEVKHLDGVLKYGFQFETQKTFMRNYKVILTNEFSMLHQDDMDEIICVSALWVWKTLFPWGHPSPLVLKILLLLLPHRVLPEL